MVCFSIQLENLEIRLYPGKDTATGLVSKWYRFSTHVMPIMHLCVASFRWREHYQSPSSCETSHANISVNIWECFLGIILFWRQYCKDLRESKTSNYKITSCLVWWSMTQQMTTQCNVLTSAKRGFHIGWHQVIFLMWASKNALNPMVELLTSAQKDDHVSPSVKSPKHVALFWDVTVSFAGQRHPSRITWWWWWRDGDATIRRQYAEPDITFHVGDIMGFHIGDARSSFWCQHQTLTLNPMVEFLTSAQNTTVRHTMWKLTQGGWV